MTFDKKTSKVFLAIISSIESLKKYEPEKHAPLDMFISRILSREYQYEKDIIDDFIGFIDIFFIEQAVDQRIWNHHQEAQRPHLSLYGRDRNNENISI